MAADVLAGIRLISKADTSGIVKMTDAVGKFQTQVRAARSDVTPFLTMSKMFVGFGLAIEASLGLATAAAINYEYLIQRIATSSGLAADQIAVLHDRFLTLSTTMATGAEDLAKLGFAASKLGLNAAGIEKFARAGAMLNTISGGTVTGEGAIGNLARISKVFGLDLAGSVDKLSSSFVVLARTSTASEAELLHIVNRVGELGRRVGFTAPELAALGATAKDLGLDGRRAAGAIENLLNAMVNKDSARFFARQLQMTGYEFNQALGKNPVAILNRLQGAFRGLDPRILEDRLKHLGITENSTKTLVLGLADGHSTLAKNIKAASEAYEKGTAAQKAYEELLETTKMQLQILWNTIRAVAISFGEVLLPPLKLVLKGLTTMLQVVLAIPKPVKVIMVAAAALVGGFFILIGVTSGVVASAIALKVAVGKAAVAIYGEGAAAFGTSFQLLAFGQSMMIAASEASFGAAAFFEAAFGAGSLGETISLLTSQLFAGEIGWTAFSAGVYEAAAAVVTLEMLTGIGEILLAVAAAVAFATLEWYALKPVLLDVFDAFKSLYTPIEVVIDGVSELAGMFGLTSGGIGETLVTFARIGLLPVIVQLKSLAFGIRLVSSILTGIARQFIALTKPIIEPFVKLWNIVKAVIQPIFDLFDAFVTGGTDAQGFFDVIASGAAFFFKWFTPIGAMLGTVGTLFQALEFIVENVWAGISEAFAPLFDEISQGFGAIGVMWSELTANFMELIDPIRIFVGEWMDGGSIITTVLRGIGSIIKWLVSTALWPIVAVFRVWNVLFAVISAMAITVGKALVVWLTPVLWIVKQIANAISVVVGGLRDLLGTSEAAVPAAASAVVAANDAILGSQIGVGMEKVSSSIPELRKPIVKARTKLTKFTMEPGSRIADVPTFDERTPRLRERAPIDDVPPAVRDRTSRLTSTLNQNASAISRSVGAPQQAPAMNITIPVSVMLDGEEIGQAVVSVRDDQIRREFGARQRRFSGVEGR